MKKSIFALVALIAVAVAGTGGYFIGAETAVRYENKIEFVEGSNDKLTIVKPVSPEDYINIIEDTSRFEYGGMVDPGPYTDEDLGIIMRRDYPLLDEYYGENDTGAIMFVDPGKEFIYMADAKEMFDGSNDEFYVETFAVGRGTTPLYNMYIYRNGKLEKGVPVDAVHFAGFENLFFKLVREEQESPDTVVKTTN